jgi:hypothetical protein
VGATPVGATSAARGNSNEAAEIISSGDNGVATIGVSGYNGSSSNDPYVLRVETTPPPTMPNCPARALTVSAGNQGTLPSSLPTSTKTLFLVNKQRLLGMYPGTNWTTFLNQLNGLAARSEVAGSVLQVDGNAAVRSAYAAWDATPCDTGAANDVVRAVNAVVAGYRNAGGGLPNLHYVVLLGNDEALPMARTFDPVTLSPEVNEAADLAFTTAGLTRANALYASAATNNILSDGAYGALSSTPWLGRELLLPQLSVSRLVESPADMQALMTQYTSNNGRLTVASALTSGYDFLADGATTVADNLAARFPTAGAGRLISPSWTSTDLLNSFFNAATVPSIGSLNAHYNHFELQPASGTSLVTTASVPTSIPGRILFTMGCHGGLNVPDSLGGDAAKLKDWTQTYLKAQAALYVANTGFGYGDSASVALSERLLSLYAANLRSDANSVGEEWVATLQQYFATAGAYDVYDEKVIDETTFYGLPFWHFSTNGASTPPAPLPTTPDPATGTQSATIAFPSPSATTQEQFGLYRPILPIKSQEVTSNLPARGVWIKALATDDGTGNVTPRIGMPTIDLAAHEPKPNVAPIFFPASPFTLERSFVFGKERDYLNVSDQFRPDPTDPGRGRQRHVTSGSFQIFYSNSTDRTAPLVSQVTVSFSGGSATIQARVTDDSGLVSEVAALVNDGSWHYVPLQPTADPTVFAATTAAAIDPEVFVEATDGANVSYSANKGSNFTTTTSAPPAGPPILIQAPVGPYGLNQPVTATYQCPGATTCVGTVASGSTIDTSTVGVHTFTVTATDASGNTTKIQRLYQVTDLLLSLSVSPTTATTGTNVTVRASLANAASVTRNVTLSGTFLYNTAFAIALPPVTIPIAGGRSFSGAFSFKVPGGLPRGTYSVVLYASDVTGTVSAKATLTVN